MWWCCLHGLVESCRLKGEDPMNEVRYHGISDPPTGDAPAGSVISVWDDSPGEQDGSLPSLLSRHCTRVLSPSTVTFGQTVE